MNCTKCKGKGVIYKLWPIIIISLFIGVVLGICEIPFISYTYAGVLISWAILATYINSKCKYICSRCAGSGEDTGGEYLSDSVVVESDDHSITIRKKKYLRGSVILSLWEAKKLYTYLGKIL